MIENRNIGTAELVNRLFFITDKEQFIRLKAVLQGNLIPGKNVFPFGKKEEEIPVFSIVILKLVNHEFPVCILFLCPDVFLFPEHFQR